MLNFPQNIIKYLRLQAGEGEDVVGAGVEGAAVVVGGGVVVGAAVVVARGVVAAQSHTQGVVVGQLTAGAQSAHRQGQ